MVYIHAVLLCFRYFTLYRIISPETNINKIDNSQEGRLHYRNKLINADREENCYENYNQEDSSVHSHESSKVITVYLGNHAKPINTPCALNAEISMSK